MYKNLEELVAGARSQGPVQIAIAAGHDSDVVAALKQAQSLGLADGIFVGDAEKIEAMAKEVDFDIPSANVQHEPDPMVAARKAIGLVRDGKAQLLMKGKINTSTLVKAVLDRETGLRGSRLLSQVIVFQVPGFDRLMIMTDAAINIAPTMAHKADLCRNAIDVAHAIGIEKPNVAMLCALEFVNPDMPATVDAAGVMLMNQRGQLPGAYVEGPIALDVPLSAFAADRKGIDSPLTNNTDIFVTPDIHSANILYRAILYFAKGESGGVVLGAKVPLILLSRAETPETKIASIAIGILVTRAQSEAAS